MASLICATSTTQIKKIREFAEAFFEIQYLEKNVNTFFLIYEIDT